MGDRIEITCTAASHGGALTLHTFEWEAGDDGRHFPHLGPKGWREVMMDDVRPGGNEIRARRHVAGVSLDGHDQVETSPEGPMGRERYKLLCRVCGDAVAVRHEHLTPILDGLAGAGVSSISLHGLRATLRR